MPFTCHTRPFHAEFLEVFEQLTKELIEDVLPQYELSEEALAYIKRVSADEWPRHTRCVALQT